MSGIVGWTDYDRDLRDQGSVLRAMVGAQAGRGPDAESIWLDNHVALGHRGLAVFRDTNGKQPVSVQVDGRDATAVTGDGNIDNHDELRKELATRGHHFVGNTDAELVGRSYLEWGTEFAEHLQGHYAWAVWDCIQERLILLRDRMGVKPLYYTETPRGLVFGSEPKAIFTHPLVEPVIDADGLREALGFVNNPGNTGYRDLFEVPAGCLLLLSRQGLGQQRYWQLEAREHTDDVDTTIATVRRLLSRSVDRKLAADAPLGSLLSGGLDSSIVTALAAQRFDAEGREPLRSFSVDFAGYAENFAADELRDTPDTPFVRAAAEHLNVSHTDIVLSNNQVIDPLVRSQATRAFDFPAGGDMFTSLYLLVSALREHATVALCGESADEIFGGYAWFHNEAAWADTFPWLAAAISGPSFSGETLFDNTLLRQLDIATYQSDSYRAALAEVPHNGSADTTEQRMREINYLHLTRLAPMLAHRQDRMSAVHGVEMRLPICDPELVQYVFNTPWSMKTFDGREKSLLRAATSDLIPESIANRVKSPYPATQDPNYERALQGQFDALLTDGTSPVLSLLDIDKAKALPHPDSAGSGASHRREIEIVLSLHDWLATSGARLALDR